MTEFKATNKAEAARKLALIDKEILDQAKFLNSKKFIPMLLCLEDAIHNLELDICKNREVNRFNQPTINLALEYFLFEWYGIINQMIVKISDNGFIDPSTKIKLPEIQFGVFIGTKHEQSEDPAKFLKELRKDKLIGQKAFFRIQSRLFLNKIPGSCCFILRDELSNKVKQNFDKILQFRSLFCKRGALQNMIYKAPNGTELKIGKNGLIEIVYPNNFFVESLLEKFGLTSRTIDAYSTVREWNSHFSDVAIETMKSLESGKCEANQKNLDAELKEQFQAYNSMKGFPEALKNYMTLI